MPIISGSSGTVGGVAVTGAAASGKVPVASSASAAAWGFPPGYEINYTQTTSSVTVSSNTESSGTTVLSPGAITFDGSAVLVNFFCPRVFVSGTALGDTVTVSLFEGSTQIGRMGLVNNVAAQNQILATNLLYRFTPSAGSHTYTITAYGANNSILACGAGGTGVELPMFVRFIKV